MYRMCLSNLDLFFRLKVNFIFYEILNIYNRIKNEEYNLMNCDIQIQLKRRIKILLLFSLPWSQVFAGSTTDNIDAFFKHCHTNGQFNGNVLVAKSGEIIYHQSFGISNIDPVEPLQLNSQFRLASVSKQFTAMAIMILKEQGKLDYEDEIIKYLPELPYPGITIRHLLNHTSGIPKYEDLCEQYWDIEHKNFLDKKYATNDDIIALFVEHHPKVLFKPGDKYAYSNAGYVLLASIVSRVSGEPFEKFLKNNIFDPLDMSFSLVYSAIRDDPVEHRVYGYRLAINGSDYLPNDFHYMSGIAGDGAIYSTTGDLFKWDRALYREKLVSKPTLDEAFSPAILSDSSTSKYGFGWGIDTSLSGKKVVSHGGGWIASRTWILREIEEDNTIILLTNHTSRYIYDIRKTLQLILHDKPFTMPKISISDVIGEIIATNGIDAAISEYQQLKKSKPGHYNFNFWELNSLGYRLTQLEKISEAVAIYKLNIKNFPDWSRAYNDLGDAYKLNGNVELALENFKKSLELDPNNNYAKEKLKKLLEN
jgi:CubicO group peptidase (beta-lactamase class C family)